MLPQDVELVRFLVQQICSIDDVLQQGHQSDSAAIFEAGFLDNPTKRRPYSRLAVRKAIDVDGEW